MEGDKLIYLYTSIDLNIQRLIFLGRLSRELLNINK